MPAAGATGAKTRTGPRRRADTPRQRLRNKNAPCAYCAWGVFRERVSSDLKGLNRRCRWRRWLEASPCRRWFRTNPTCCRCPSSLNPWFPTYRMNLSNRWMDWLKKILASRGSTCLPFCCSQPVPAQRPEQAPQRFQFSVTMHSYQFSFERLEWLTVSQMSI